MGVSFWPNLVQEGIFLTFANIWSPKRSRDNVGTGVTNLEDKVKATSKSYFDELSLFSFSCVIRVLV